MFTRQERYSWEQLIDWSLNCRTGHGGIVLYSFQGTYDKFQCEIISVKRCPTENFQWPPGFSGYSVNCWNFTEIYTTENIMAPKLMVNNGPLVWEVVENVINFNVGKFLSHCQHDKVVDFFTADHTLEWNVTKFSHFDATLILRFRTHVFFSWFISHLVPSWTRRRWQYFNEEGKSIVEGVSFL